MANSLRNNNLLEAPLPATLYNQLPHIDTMRNAAAANAAAHAALLGMIAAHRLAQHFSIHLIHKHFDIPDGRVMVYETIEGSKHPSFVLCSPRKPTECINMRGLYFQARSGGTMAAYEYTTDAAEDLSAHSSFVACFAQKVLDLGVQDVFALTAKKPHQRVLTEFEMGDRLSTVLVEIASWLSWDPDNTSASTSTDWLATDDYAEAIDGPNSKIPGIISLKCTTTSSDNHYNVTCSITRGGNHYEHAANIYEDGREEILLNGKPVDMDSEPFSIISRAMELTQVF